MPHKPILVDEPHVRQFLVEARRGEDPFPLWGWGNQFARVLKLFAVLWLDLLALELNTSQEGADQLPPGECHSAAGRVLDPKVGQEGCLAKVVRPRNDGAVGSGDRGKRRSCFSGRVDLC